MAVAKGPLASWQPHAGIALSLQRGFTLLEILIVLGLLALLAGISLMAYEGIQSQGQADLVRYEMAEIRRALIQFRKDSGTYAFPGVHSYDCTDAINGGSSTQANSRMLFPAEAGTTDSEKITWCQDSANFWMLLTDPYGLGWNEDTRRGWRGPYLKDKHHTTQDLNGRTIPTLRDPYNTPYHLLNLTQDASASLISAGENRLFGTVTDCASDDSDDIVLCLLR